MSFKNGLNNNYHNCKIECKAVTPGTLSSFIYAYCKTVNVPEHMERAFIRKAVSFAKLAKYVRLNLTNDFDTWYRINEDSQTLCDVLTSIINIEDCRNETYNHIVPGKKKVSETFYFSGVNIPYVLRQI